MKKGKSKANINVNIKSLFIVILILVSIFSIKYWFDMDKIETKYNTEIASINKSEQLVFDMDLEGEWIFLENTLQLKLIQAHKEGSLLGDWIEREVLAYYGSDIEKLQYDLVNIDVDNHPIMNILRETLTDYRFDGIFNDSNDPFVIMLKLIVQDDSINCAIEIGRTRTIAEEMPMHSNETLAILSLTRVVNMDVSDRYEADITNPIFFQFLSNPNGEVTKPTYEGIYEPYNGKKEQILTHYNIEGLKNYFKKYGDWKDTFQALEFISPIYLNPDKNIAGDLYVDKGYRTSIEPIIINIVFNFKDVIENSPEILSKLEWFKYRKVQVAMSFDSRRDQVKEYYIHEETDTMFTTILLISIFILIMVLYSQIHKEKVICRRTDCNNLKIK